MSVPVLDAIAQSIYAFEGSAPGDRAYRNCNPGNLRPTDESNPRDAGGYRVFQDFLNGYIALLDDLHGKVTGRNDHGLGPKSTLLDLFEVYAPAADRNAPETYATFVAGRLCDSYGTKAITFQTRIDHIYEIVGEVMPHGVAAA